MDKDTKLEFTDVVDAIVDYDVHAYVEQYEFRGDFDYTPTDREATLIEDACEGLRGDLIDALRKLLNR